MIISTPYDSSTFGNSLSLRVDNGVGSISINPSGRDVVLAGRRGIYVVDLDDPFSPPRWLHHLTSWEVADVQWSPHLHDKPSSVISTSNQKALIWNLARSGDEAIEMVLHGHSRAITDINFHPSNPDLVATCSVDTFVLAWDTRAPKRPVYAVEDWRAGASQVKWNYQNPNLLASAHNNYFYVWDLRNSFKPIHKVYAHDRKINGVDFSRTNENELISCSNDQTVKFWDLSKDVQKPQSVINTDFPVWKARNLPFGEGCAVIPLRGGNNSIYVAKKPVPDAPNVQLDPQAVFKGHTDRVTDFLWRSRNHTDTAYDDREFQLVTWSKDCDLKLWGVNEDLYPKLNHRRGKPIPQPYSPYSYTTYREEPPQRDTVKPFASNSSFSLNLTHNEMFVSGRTDQKNATDHLNWISGVRIGRSAYNANQMTETNSDYNSFEQILDNLGEEVSVIGHKFPKVKFEKISVSTGVLILSLAGPWNVTNPDDLIYLRVEIKFPQAYPSQPPVFKIEENRELTKESRVEILTDLSEITSIYSRHDKFSLEICLRYLMGDRMDVSKLEAEITAQQDQGHLNDIYNLPPNIDDLDSLPSSSDHEVEEYYGDDNDSTDGELGDDELVPGLQMTQTLTNDSNKMFDSTPIPKGCGAVWSRQGKLVCFFMPKNSQAFNEGHDDSRKTLMKFDHTKQVLFDNDELSDGSLSDDFNDILRKDLSSRRRIPGVFRIQNFNQSFSGAGSSIHAATETVRTGVSSTYQRSQIEAEDDDQPTKNVVAVFDFSDLIPTKYDLADEYKVVGDTAEALSLYNSEICAKYGYTELSDTWRVLSTVFSTDFDWGVHPLGKTWLIKELMTYYERLGDVQMLAMMTCIIEVSTAQLKEARAAVEPDIFKPLVKEHNSYTNNMTYQRDYRLRSMSSNESTYRLPFSRSSSVVTKENERSINVKIEMFNEVQMGFMEDEKQKLKNDFDLLGEDQYSKFNDYRSEYANILYAWGFILRRAEILKFNFDTNATVHVLHDEEFQTKLKVPKADKVCVYCGLKVARRIFVCFNCDHAQHTDCGQIWWAENDECPTGCGCHCMEH
ncbi:hypothetical protein WICPIJ_007225 [Wickerhamomyces pijperi]|uniref:RWD domain-containing protein n=1 Tax=Wickerhamomyces pijperi TaxID=599730 RepID=A0A9P8TKL8_WICPI|nr:hypothetical protein WICPIJ_007225 [Wickerhamomyces pijperi]